MGGTAGGGGGALVLLRVPESMPAITPLRKERSVLPVSVYTTVGFCCATVLLRRDLTTRTITRMMTARRISPPNPKPPSDSVCARGDTFCCLVDVDVSAGVLAAI